jgi:hypothetical protein
MQRKHPKRPENTENASAPVKVRDKEGDTSLHTRVEPKKKIRLEVQGIAVSVLSKSRQDYISLTDIARFKNPRIIDDLIRNWLRNRNTIEFLGVWERLNNPDFNPVEFDGIKIHAGLNSFTLTPKQWIDKTGATGLISTPGRYGGTYAHKDAACRRTPRATQRDRHPSDAGSGGGEHGRTRENVPKRPLFATSPRDPSNANPARKVTKQKNTASRAESRDIFPLIPAGTGKTTRTFPFPTAEQRRTSWSCDNGSSRLRAAHFWRAPLGATKLTVS